MASDANDQDRLVASAFDALRQTSVEGGPSPEAVSRTIAAAHEVASQETFVERIYRMPWMYKALVGTGTLAAALIVAFVLLLPSGRSIALADVVERLREAKRVSFIVEEHSPDPVEPVTKTRVWLLDPDKMRTEWDLPQAKIEFVWNGDKSVRLDHTKKTAVLHEAPPGARGSERQALDDLQLAVEANSRSLGEKDIGGVRAKGFEATIKGRKITLWANAKTGNPIRIEYPLTEIPPPHGPVLKILTDFVFDEDFDPKFFSLDVPQGYQVSKFEPVRVQPVEDMVAILRLYSQHSGGEFPARLDDDGRSVRATLGLPEDPAAMTEDQRELAKRLSGLLDFLKREKSGEVCQYYPGAKLGDKDRLVFWCLDPPITGTFIPLIPRPDADAAPPPKPEERKYLGVYGDLRIEKLNKADLPPAAAEPSDESK